MENHEFLERLTGLVDTIIARGTVPQQQQVGQVETTEEALRTLYPSVRGRGGGSGSQSKSTRSRPICITVSEAKSIGYHQVPNKSTINAEQKCATVCRVIFN